MKHETARLLKKRYAGTKVLRGTRKVKKRPTVLLLSLIKVHPADDAGAV